LPGKTHQFLNRPYLSNGRAYGTVVVCPFVVVRRLSSVTDVLWLSKESNSKK